MDADSFITGMKALITSFIDTHPEISFLELDDLVTIALEEIGEEEYTTVEADNDD